MVVIPRSPVAARSSALTVAITLALSLSPAHAAPQVPRQQPPEAAPGSATLTGRVVSDDDGTPIRRARVVLHGVPATVTPQGPADARPEAGAQIAPSGVAPVAGQTGTRNPGAIESSRQEAETDASGWFVFRNLPSGRYFVSIMEATGYVPPRSGGTIEIAAGATATTVLRLERAGAIAGRVLDDEGSPVARAMVRAARWESPWGARRMVQMQGTSTDDRGDFRIFGLPAGEYYVSASPAFRAPSGAGGSRTGYVPSYFPGAASIAGATPVAVRPGADTAGIEIRLLTAAVASITGTIIGPDGRPLPSTLRPAVTLVSRDDGQSSSTGSMVRPDGTFELAGVGPGDYYLAATAFPAAPSGQTPAEGRPGAFTALSVDGADLTVDLALNEGATVSGQVRLEGPADAPPNDRADPLAAAVRWPPGGLTATRIFVNQDPAFPLAIVGSFGIRPPVVAEDGSFTVGGLRGWLRFGAIGSGILKAILLNGRDITATSMELEGNERIEGLEIVLTRDVGVLQGRVTDRAGNPVAAVVVAFPDDDTRWYPGSPFVRTARAAGPTAAQVQPAMSAAGHATSPPGSFTISPGLLPGRYRVVAIEPSSGSGMPTDGATLTALAPDATTATIEAGRTTVVDLRVLPDPTKGRTPSP